MKTYKICSYKNGEAFAKTYYNAIFSLTEARKLLKKTKKITNGHNGINFGIWLGQAIALTIYSPLITDTRNKEIK